MEDLYEGGVEKTFINPRSREREHYLLVAGSGARKSTSIFRMAQEWKAKGGKVITITDTKHQFEEAYSCITPRERYHQQELKKQGEKPEITKVEIYHPLTFNIPKQKLPNIIKFFSINIKTLGEEELSYLIGNPDRQSTPIKVMQTTLDSLKSKQGFLEFLHLCEENLDSVEKTIAGKSVSMPDPRNHWLRTPPIGNIAVLRSISSYFTIFNNHPFITDSEFEHNIDMEKIINNQQTTTVFSSKYFRKSERKIKNFIVLYILNQINEIIGKAKYPLLIVIGEIAEVFPPKSRTFTNEDTILITSVSSKLKQWRSEGKGTSIVAGSQYYLQLPDQLSQVFTFPLFGKLAPNDIDKIVKAINMTSTDKDMLVNIKKGEWVDIMGKKKVIKSLMPGHSLPEVFYTFEEEFRKDFGFKNMVSYQPILKEFKSYIDSKEKIVKEWAMKRVEKDIKKIKSQEKQKKEKSNDSGIEVKKELKKVKIQKQYDEWDMMWAEWNSLPKEQRSFRKVSLKVKKNHVTVKRFIQIAEALFEGKNEEDIIKLDRVYYPKVYAWFEWRSKQ